MAKAALAALRPIVPKVAAAVEKDLVGKDKPFASWKSAGKGDKDEETALSADRLREIAGPFYARLHEFAPQWLELKLKENQAFSEGSFFPWAAIFPGNAVDAPVTLNQLKAVFALDFASDGEGTTNLDGIPDLWEYGVVHADTTGKWTDIQQINLLNAASIGAKSPAGPPPKTFALEATKEVDRRLAGKSPEKSLAMYDDYPTKAAAGKLVRNRNFWAADLGIELTCLSPWNFMDMTKRAGTVLTPRHVLVAKHFFLNPGTVIHFVTADNENVVRTVLAAASVENPVHPPGLEAYTDFEIAVLDTDLPKTIKPCLVAPADFDSYLPPVVPQIPVTGTINSPPIPSLTSNQHKEGIVTQLQAVLIGPQSSTIRFNPPDEKIAPLRQAFNRPIIIGDSGSPDFFIVDGKLMLATVWTGGGGGAGWALWHYLPQVNAAIAAADAKAKIKPTGYKVKEMDLSRFVKFN